MARNIGPSCRLCRREGIKLFLKGPRCVTDKCAVSRRAFAPGQHGQMRKKESNYGVQLREKQKVKRISAGYSNDSTGSTKPALASLAARDWAFRS